MATPVLPDIEAIAAFWLRSQGITGGRCFWRFPTNPVYPLTVIQRIGGVPVDPRWHDRASIQGDVWADTQEAARDGAAAAYAALQDMSGFIDTGTVSGTVAGAEAGPAPKPFPDPEREKDRYTFTMTIYAHP